MYAPPSINEFKLSNINCIEENHKNNPIVGICIDKKCNNENKFMCLDCMFDKHNGHIGIKSKEIEEIINMNLKEKNKNNEIFNQKYDEFKKMLRNKIDEFKIKMNKYIEEYYNNFLKIFNEKLKFNKGNSISNILENFPPKNKEQIFKLKDELLNLYENKDKKENENKKEQILNNYKIYEKCLINGLNNLENYIIKLKENPISREDNFEWSTVTYSKYDFYYKLEQNNTKVTKISNDGTMTICRGIKNLEKGNIYKLDYFINYKKGNFDIGFGDDSIGGNCWLGGEKSYCVSNEGIYVNGIKKDNNNYLNNYKKITFIINFIQFSYEIYFNEKKMYDFNFNSQLIYYPMVAMKDLNNSVTLKLYKLNNK